MKNYKTILGLLGAASLLGSVTACGPKEDGIKLTFWHTFGGTVAENVQNKVNKFVEIINKEENVKLSVDMQYHSGYQQINEDVVKSFQASTTPTIAVAYADHVADYLYAESKPGQYVVDLTQYINDSEVGFGKEAILGDVGEDNNGDAVTYDAEDFVKTFYDEGKCYTREGIYSLAFMKSTEVMFYNYDYVNVMMQYVKPEIQNNKAEIQKYLDNLSWSEFMDLCSTIKSHARDKDAKGEDLYSALCKNGNEYVAPCIYDSDGNMIITMLEQCGIKYSDIVNGKGVISYANSDNLANTTALVKELKDWYQDGLFATKGTTGEYGSNAFTELHSVFSIGSTGGSGYNFSQNIRNLGVCRVPCMNNQRKYVSQGITLTILNNAKFSAEENALKAKYAWRLLKFLTNPETNTELCVRGSEGYMPVRKSAFNTEEYIDYMLYSENYATVANLVYNELMGTFFNSYVFKGSSKLRTITGSMLTDAITAADGVTVEQAIANAVSTANGFIQ